MKSKIFDICWILSVIGIVIGTLLIIGTEFYKFGIFSFVGYTSVTQVKYLWNNYLTYRIGLCATLVSLLSLTFARLIVPKL